MSRLQPKYGRRRRNRHAGARIGFARSPNNKSFRPLTPSGPGPKSAAGQPEIRNEPDRGTKHGGERSPASDGTPRGPVLPGQINASVAHRLRTFSLQSWPGLSRPSTSFYRRSDQKGRDAREDGVPAGDAAGCSARAWTGRVIRSHWNAFKGRLPNRGLARVVTGGVGVGEDFRDIAGRTSRLARIVRTPPRSTAAGGLVPFYPACGHRARREFGAGFVLYGRARQ